MHFFKAYRVSNVCTCSAAQTANFAIVRLIYSYNFRLKSRSPDELVGENCTAKELILLVSVISQNAHSDSTYSWVFLEHDFIHNLFKHFLHSETRSLS
jgi:hypothetical protein